jgi:RNA polymerase sigma-B factor
VSGERGDDEEPGGILLGADDPRLAGADDRVMLREALASLPPRERRILELRFAEGLSQSEIAEHVGVSQVHVSRLLRKSIRLLQEHLGHGGDQGVDDAGEG